MRQSANHRGSFRINQLLIHTLQSGSHPVGQVRVFQLGKQSKHGRIVGSHRV
jgi:hypothetical protein